ncbi:MAG TPA: phosphoserine phosphatase SerB [Hyphomicrobiaceae bacterium]|nr:phosphoserine phosphatase SerB [Hyphomicrobiaceae bacterium]
MSETLCRALVLTANPQIQRLSAAQIDTARAALGSFHVIQEDVLADGNAWRMLFAAGEDIALGALRTDVMQALEGQPLDINVIADDLAFTRKRLLVADMESTIIAQEMLDELGDLIGKRQLIEDITARAMRGELDFEAALKARLAMLAGLDASVLDEVAQRITIMPGARELVATMKANGAWCALVSGGFTFFTERIAHELGFDEHQANTLEIIDGKITGRALEPILGRQAKLAALRRIAAARGIDATHTLAVGDGANDLAMLGEASLGVAFRAKPKVREAALANPGGAVITHGDLSALLYLQGYRASQFSNRA